ncbi:MAG: hypothetical protein WDA20_13110 [Desulfuromonadales bacterium]
MPAGPKPKPDGTTVHRNQLVHEWTEVIDVPFRGKRPTLPRGTSQQTRAWWGRVTRLPHCVLWGDGDWQFALDTARVHNAFVHGDLARAAELRIREDRMGTTLGARRDLRIRYVDAVTTTAAPAAEDPKVSNFEDERRQRIAGQG